MGQPYQTHPPAELKFSQTETDRRGLTKQAVSKIPSNKGFLSQLFSVPKKDGGIINLKGLNTFVETVHFKMEGIHVLRDTLKPDDWMTKVDLKDAYFMIPMASHHKRLLRFRWQGQTYQFNCLPFGLSSTPWVFTTITLRSVRVTRDARQIRLDASTVEPPITDTPNSGHPPNNGRQLVSAPE